MYNVSDWELTKYMVGNIMVLEIDMVLQNCFLMVSKSLVLPLYLELVSMICSEGSISSRLIQLLC